MIATAVFNNVVRIDIDPELDAFLEGFVMPAHAGTSGG